MLTTIWAFLLALALLIVIHEYGHYRVAVACGVKVLRFSVGFGPVLLRRQRGETEFVLSALPLGGYVKMLDEREAPVASHELNRAFNRKPLLQRALIVAAGPAANLLLAVALYAAVNWIGIEEIKPVIGQPVAGSVAARADLQAGDWVRAASVDGQEWVELRSMSDLNWHVMQAALDRRPLHLSVSHRDGAGQREVVLDVPSAVNLEVDAELLQRIGFGGPYAEPMLARVLPGGPADKAGLRSGDRVLAVDEHPVADAAALLAAIRQTVRPGQAQADALELKVLRDGHEHRITVRPDVRKDGEANVARIDAQLGGSLAMVTVRYGGWEGLQRGFERTWDVSVLTMQMIGRMLIGEASLKNLSGPLTMADFAGRSVEVGWTAYLGFLALVSVSLGVLNLLPLPMLDGGHLMYYLFEGVTGRPISDVWLDRLQRGGLAILLLMMSLALYNDMARLFGAS